MKGNALAKNYKSLTAEERFRLILAAGARGDEAERDRLISTGQRIVLSTQEHAPFARAFDELSLLIFIELQEEAARYLEAFARANHVDDLFGDDEEEDSGEVEEKEGETIEKEEPEGKANAESVEVSDGERPIFQRYLDVALAAGFVLRTKAEGWKLFCERLTVPPFALWEGLPGFERLQRALDLSEKVSFEAEGFLRWLNAIRPAGEPERLKVPLTTEGLADATEELFQERVEWWGG
jgi:hypothetical protein